MKDIKLGKMKPKRQFSPMKAMMLILLLGFAAGNAMAQNDKAIRGHEGGLKGGEPPYLNKVYKEPVGGSNVGTLTLETYATGETILTEKRVPTDIVLVLDMSGSMGSTNDPMYEPQGPRDWTYNNRPNNGTSFYYKDGNTYRVVTFGISGNKRYISFKNANDKTRYLYGNEQVTNNSNVPSASPTSDDGTIFRGTLYKKETKLEALKRSVSAFIDIIDNDAQTHLDEHGNPVDHKISIVKFAGNRYYGTGESDLTEGDDTYPDGWLFPSYYNYTQVVKNLTVVRTASQSNANVLKTAVNGLHAAGATASDYGMTKAKYVLDQSVSTEENPRKKVVVMFTDGEPNHGSGFDNNVANNCIAASKTMKAAGAVVYTIGVFSSTSNEIDTYMSYTSSKYPNAQSMTNGGSSDDGNFYFTAQTSDQLEDIFTSIAEQSGSEPMSMGSETIVQDIISEYFKLPEGAIPESIKVFIADCNGVSSHPQSGQTYDERGRSFVPENEWFKVTASTNPSITDMVTFTDNNTNIQVTGFDFSVNWCGWNDNLTPTPGVQGKKLVIQIPIVPKDNTWGDNLDTNGEMSILIPNGDESEIFHYPKPLTTIVRKTWVDVVHRFDLVPAGTWVEENGVIKLKSKEALAWFISYVNGYNGEPVHAKAKGVLDVDVDMSEWNWVPIGGMEGYWIYNENDEVVGWQASQCITGFEGTFDGNGHAIRGLRNQATVVPVAGMFGTLNGAEVKNTFVVDCNFQTGREGYFGIIADSIFNGAVIYNCEASGILRTHNINPAVAHESNPNYYAGLVTYEPINAHLGGIVGLVGRNRQTGASSAGEVHSCISTAYLKGYDMGGLVSELDNENCLLNNCFSYPAYHIWQPTENSSIGGFASTNKAGKIQNCYLRERATVVTGESNDYHYGINGIIQYISGNQNGKGYTPRATKYRFNGLFVGENLSTLNYCYYPEYGDGVTVAPFVSAKPTGYSGTLVQAGGVGKFTATSTPYMYKHADNDVTLESSTGSNSYIKSDDTWPRFLKTMNNWVEANGPSKYTKWFRTTADGVNNDYPVLKIMDFNTVGSDDQVVLFYGDINEMMGMTGTDTPTRYFLTEGKTDDVMCLYQNAVVTTGNNGATLYINEDVAITQNQPLTAYVGITLDNSAGENGADSGHPLFSVEDEIDWHMFSTSLSNAPLGINYTDSNVHDFSYDPADNPDYPFFDEDVKDGYFPSKTYGTGADYNADWDFYTFEEKYHHWMNFKRNSKSHWDEDPNTGHKNLPYSNGNGSNLEPGKGYLLAIANETFLQSHGTLNNGNLTYSASYTSNPFTVGYNLIGNPYQSYLDFSKFVETNSTIDSYVILDEDAQGYVTGAASGSDNTYPEGYVAPGNMIHMHQGFFVHVDEATEITFNNGMRSIDKTSEPYFRGSKHNYPLVNLVVKEENGNREYLTVETNRPSVGGAKKLNGLRAGNSQMYAHADNNDYAILFATEDMNEVPVRFTTEADATYTMIWNTQNGEFTKLQLIDNIAGVTVDMLTSDEYTFTSKTSDFESRFRLVFHAIDNDEDDDEAETEDGDFAFFDGSNLVVSGAGMLSVCDINGRVIYSTNLNGTQSSVSMPDMARGLYLLRLTSSESTKVQKIVIRK